MNKFTDADLAKLKAKILKSPQGSIFEPLDKWWELVHRLESAENVCKAKEYCLDLNNKLSGTEEWNLIMGAMNEWRKSCGREAR